MTALDDDCVEWQGARDPRGYGIRRIAGRRLPAHRLAWEAAYGPIPEGLVICHRCDNPPCFRLSHLFLGTKTDNNRDMVAKGRHWSQRKTHCPQGHELAPPNLVPSSESRRCLKCRRVQVREAQRRYLAKRVQG